MATNLSASAHTKPPALWLAYKSRREFALVRKEMRILAGRRMQISTRTPASSQTVCNKKQKLTVKRAVESSALLGARWLTEERAQVPACCRRRRCRPYASPAGLQASTVCVDVTPILMFPFLLLAAAADTEGHSDASCGPATSEIGRAAERTCRRERAPHRCVTERVRRGHRICHVSRKKSLLFLVVNVYTI